MRTAKLRNTRFTFLIKEEMRPKHHAEQLIIEDFEKLNVFSE